MTGRLLSLVHAFKRLLRVVYVATISKRRPVCSQYSTVSRVIATTKQPQRTRDYMVFPGGYFNGFLSATGFPCDLEYDSCSQKLRVPGLLAGKNRVILNSLVLTHYQRVTDRRTDRHSAHSEVAL